MSRIMTRATKEEMHRLEVLYAIKHTEAYAAALYGEPAISNAKALEASRILRRKAEIRKHGFKKPSRKERREAGKKYDALYGPCADLF